MSDVLPIKVIFATAFLGGYFEEAPAEVQKHWAVLRGYLDISAQLATALEPFALYGCGGLPSDIVITSGSSMAKRQLTAGDCHRAAATLALLS